VTGEAEETIAARGALLDALTALEAHIEAFVLVGAQAIYVRVGEADVAVPGSTTDGDLAVDPDLLNDAPLLAEAMQGAHFRLREERPGVQEPGIWEVEFDGPTVDLLVPRSLRPVGRRGARLGVHGNKAAKTVPGLEGALVDRDRMPIRGLEPGDRRTFTLWVAGPAALLVMKAHKIGEHLEHGRALEDKDAYDVLRLLRDIRMADLVQRFGGILASPLSSEAARRGVQLLEQLFGDRESVGSLMAGRAAGALADPDVVATACATLTRDLLNGIATAAQNGDL
jgi:hypothetical protein